MFPEEYLLTVGAPEANHVFINICLEEEEQIMKTIGLTIFFSSVCTPLSIWAEATNSCTQVMVQMAG